MVKGRLLTTGSVIRKIGNLSFVSKINLSYAQFMSEICEGLSEIEVDLYTYRGYCISIQ